MMKVVLKHYSFIDSYSEQTKKLNPSYLYKNMGSNLLVFSDEVLNYSNAFIFSGCDENIFQFPKVHYFNKDYNWNSLRSYSIGFITTNLVYFFSDKRTINFYDIIQHKIIYQKRFHEINADDKIYFMVKPDKIPIFAFGVYNKITKKKNIFIFNLDFELCYSAEVKPFTTPIFNSVMNCVEYTTNSRIDKSIIVEIVKHE